MKDWFNVNKNHWKSMEDKTQPLPNIQRWAGSFRKTEPKVYISYANLWCCKEILPQVKMRPHRQEQNPNPKQLTGCISFFSGLPHDKKKGSYAIVFLVDHNREK